MEHDHILTFAMFRINLFESNIGKEWLATFLKYWRVFQLCIPVDLVTAVVVDVVVD